ncbi:MAG TPA: hypothetical protein VMU84_06430 [Thermoanaerobaculia bacterium]|nr:hypothetical protein [Thermoanaerobaculia bacterium]
MRRLLIAIETEINYILLPVRLDLQRHEQIIVRARVKDCESAVDSLRRRQKLASFDANHPASYSLTALPDLVGARILAFPQRRLADVQRIIASRIDGWVADPVPGDESGEDAIALKYHGLWSPSDLVRSEIQFVSLLTGLFWDVEHSAIYKPSPKLRGIARSMAMKSRISAVHNALRSFEEEFEQQIAGTSE